MSNLFRCALLVTLLAPAVARADGGPKLEPFQVPNEWTDDYVRSHYGLEPRDATTIIGQLDADVGVMNLMDPWAPWDAKKVADGCRAAWPNDPWQQIHCASVESDKFVMSHVSYDANGVAGLRSFCRDHAMFFEMVFADLGIQGADAGTLVIQAHIVNKVTVTGADGRPYTYVLDTGWDPGNLYPYGGNARARFRNGDGLPALEGNDVFDPLALPILHDMGGAFGILFPTDPNASFRTLLAAGEMNDWGDTGTNVPRDSRTTPFVSGPGSGGGASPVLGQTR